MKKSLFIKTGKILLGISCTVFLSLLVWANWNERPYSKKAVGDTHFISYDISGAALSNTMLLEKKISLIDGVSSCSINGVSKVAGIIFYTSRLSPEELQSKLADVLDHSVSEKIIEAQKGGCPVGGIRYFMLGIKETLCFRS
jgi:hypothetical protein